MSASQRYRNVWTFTMWMVVGILLYPAGLWANCVCCRAKSVSITSLGHAERSCCAARTVASERCPPLFGEASEIHDCCQHCGKYTATARVSLVPEPSLPDCLIELSPVDSLLRFDTHVSCFVPNAHLTATPPTWQSLYCVWLN